MTYNWRKMKKPKQLALFHSKRTQHEQPGLESTSPVLEVVLASLTGRTSVGEKGGGGFRLLLWILEALGLLVP